MRFIRTSGLLGLIFVASACLGPQVIAQTKPVAKPKAVRKAKEASAARAVNAAAPVAKPAEAPAAPARQSANKRDPFAALISERKEAGGGLHLPPGKAGLVISTVRVDGAVQLPRG